jgi:hypothetical protein
VTDEQPGQGWVTGQSATAPWYKGQQPPYDGWCGTHQKELFHTRKRAKARMKAKSKVKGKNGMRSYSCSAMPGFFHIGHFPEEVARGEKTADEVYGDDE